MCWTIKESGFDNLRIIHDGYPFSSSLCCKGSFPNSAGVKVTVHLLIMPKLKMCGILPSVIYVLRAWYLKHWESYLLIPCICTAVFKNVILTSLFCSLFKFSFIYLIFLLLIFHSVFLRVMLLPLTILASSCLDTNKIKVHTLYSSNQKAKFQFIYLFIYTLFLSAAISFHLECNNCSAVTRNPQTLLRKLGEPVYHKVHMMAEDNVHILYGILSILFRFNGFHTTNLHETFHRS
jgi:hypothetical protein